jgi:tetratricopeptide (TPR) repeat protein
MTPLYQLLSYLALGIGAFLVNVLLHELGHAIPVLFWSKKKVTIYIGSLGDPDGSLRLSLGSLDLFVKYNPFLWMRGLCKHEVMSVKKQIIITAMGPLFSLLITLTSFLLLKTIDPDERQTVILVTFMVVGGVFTLSSAIPRGRLSPTHSGGGVRNDASQILQLWRTRNLPAAYMEAWDMFRAKEYASAAELIEKMLAEGCIDIAVYRQAFIVYFQWGKYERAEVIMESIRKRGRLSPDDQISDGCLMIMKGRFREAVAIFRELLRLQHNHFVLLNNMAYALIAAGEPKEAMYYLDRGINLAPRFSELYANRAWAKMEMRQWEEGLTDAQHALELNADSATAYHTLGLYALQQEDLHTAKEHFTRSLSLEPRGQFVEAHLADIERRLAER